MINFYVGIVEDRLDPLECGRCKVRVVNVHTEDKSQLPTEELPWAIPMSSIDSASVSGKGKTPMGPVEGTTVIIFFVDKDQQEPVMFGTVPGIPQDQSNIYQYNEVLDTSGSVETYQETNTPVISPDPIDIDDDSIIGPLAKLVAKAESGAAGYNAFNRGTSGGRIVGGGSMNLVDMTIAEIMQKQALPSGNPERLFAVGKYQTIPSTLKEACRSLNLDINTKFNPRVQDTICQEYLVARKRSQLIAYYSNPDRDNEELLKSAGIALAAEFASIEDPRFKGFPYGGRNGSYYRNGNRAKTMYDSQIKPTLKAEWDFRNKGKGSIEQSPIAKVGRPPSQEEKQESIEGKSSNVLQEVQTSIFDSFSSILPIGGKSDSGNISLGGNSNLILGFVDPNGVYPLYTNEPDVNRLARNKNISKTVVLQKEATRDVGVQIGNGGTFSQPPIPYNAEYPFNHVYESESGHITEFDDTPGSERIHIYHKSGTFSEIDANGTKVDRIVGDNYEIINRNGYIHIKGGYNVSIDGSYNVRVDNNYNLEVSGTSNINIYGNSNVNIVGDTNLGIAGTYNVKADKINMESLSEFNIRAAESINLQSDSEINIKSTDELYIDSTASIHLKSNENIFAQASEEINIKSGTNTNIQSGADVNLLVSGTFLSDAEITSFNNGETGEAKEAIFAKEASLAEVEVPVGERNTSGIDQLPELPVVARGYEVGFDSPDDGDPTEYVSSRISNNTYSEYEIKEQSVVLDRNKPNVTPSTTPINAECDIILSMDPSLYTASMKLSKYFTLGDLTKNGSRIPRRNYVVKGIEYTPQQIVCNMKGLCENVLDPIVEKYGRDSFTITSGFRVPPVGNIPGSLGLTPNGTPRQEGGDHPIGCAADLVFKAGRSEMFRIANELTELLPSFNQIILEYTSRSCWIHVAFKYEGNKGEFFTMNNHRTYASTYPRGGFVLI